MDELIREVEGLRSRGNQHFPASYGRAIDDVIALIRHNQQRRAEGDIVYRVAKAICKAHGQWAESDWNVKMWLDHAQAAIAALEPCGEWRDIASAPTDGSDILLAHDGYVSEGFWSKIFKAFLPAGSEVSEVTGAPNSCFTTVPTHWQPMPAPPRTPSPQLQQALDDVDSKTGLTEYGTVGEMMGDLTEVKGNE